MTSPRLRRTPARPVSLRARTPLLAHLLAPLGGMRRAFALCALALLVQALPSHAAIELRTLIDSDNDAATGCTVATPAGTFSGADQAAVTRIDLSAPSPVGDVTRETCQGGVLSADPGFVPLAPARWPLGVGAAGTHRDVVESYALSAAPLGGARLGFSAGTTDASLPPGALLSADGSAGGAAIVLAAPAAAPFPVPVAGAGGLLLLALTLAFATHRFTRLRQLAASVSALCLLLAVGLAWAAITRDGSPSDWSGVAPVATDPVAGPLRFAAVYAQAEGNTLHLRYDLDLGVRNGTPAADGPYAATVGTPLVVAAPGVLGNDALGAPPLQVREFRMVGSATATAAGGAVAFAGGTLTVNADGGFALGAPALAGTFQFEYRADNTLTTGGWGVATVTIGASALCGDNIVSGSEACDDGNTTTETSCPYGTVSCTRCDATCSTLLTLAGGYCGDNTVNGGEACDDGNTTTETSCPYGTVNCTQCDATCSTPLTLAGGYCGDNTVNGGETCDDGNTTTETSCAYGTVSCTRCDASCSTPLTLTGGYCGDNTVNGGEACDDGNTINGDGCSNMCSFE